MTKLDEAAKEYVCKSSEPYEDKYGNNFLAIKNRLEDFKAGAEYERKRAEVLVEALSRIANEASGLLYAHEHALSMDGGNSNAQCLSLRVDEARLAIQKYKESEGGGE